ncbi:MAG: UDP-glucose/GDP-mannose dehydrogenase family protein [Clostridiales bacterium]|nr:UDP-glucose/GDP-mannose dehydrogenase family protein [Clostridiales bacterium]
MRAYQIAVAGTGYVGIITGTCMAHVGHQVTCVDVDAQKVASMNAGIAPIYEDGLQALMQENLAAGRLTCTTDAQAAYRNADVIFICVGTPEKPDGSADLTYIATVARQVAESVEKDCVIVVKSTVPVGTNDKVEQFIRDFLARDVRVEVASNPEFLAQGSAVHDMLHAARIIIGTACDWARETLADIYAPFGIPTVFMGRESAEMTKYAANNFLALKLSFINEIANLCELIGADISEVTRGMSFDDRIGARFLNAGVGYGGSCFPKDTKALALLAKQCGYDLKTVNAAIDVNKAQKLRLFDKACERVISFHGLKTAVLGATFKPETDDLREAPAMETIEKLLAHGAEIIVYDPVGLDNLKKIYGDKLAYAGSPEDALKGAALAFVFTEWPQIRALAPETFKKQMRTAIVYDGRNLYDPAAMAQAGVKYESIGRG